MSKESKKKKNGREHPWSDRERIEYLELTVHSMRMEDRLRKARIERLEKAVFGADSVDVDRRFRVVR